MVLLLPLFCGAQNSGALVFEEKEFDFGTINESDGRVTHSFRFVNMGKNPVYIASVVPSCACTTYSLEENNIPAGASASIEVSYDPALLPGPFRQNVLVRTADKNSFRLYVQGNVVGMDTEDRYPYELSKGLRANTDELKFGFVQQGTVMEKSFRILNAGTETVNVALSLEAKDDAIVVDAPRVFAPGAKAEVVVRINAPSGRLGTLRNALMTPEGQTPWGQGIRITGSLVHVLSLTEAGPSLRFEPTRIAIRRGGGQTVLYNDGASDLHILKIELPAGASVNIAEGTAIKPGDSLKLKVSGLKGLSFVRLFTDDPRRPMREILTINSR